MLLNTRRIAAKLLLITMLLCGSSGMLVFNTWLSGAFAYAKMTENPHNKMDCGTCHKGAVSFGKTPDNLEFIENDIVNLCLKCHSEIKYVHHPQRVQVVEEVPDYLPLGKESSITCPTCHDVHLENVSMRLLRSAEIGNYTSRVDICYECHKENFNQISPHKSKQEGMSCLVCHRDAPTIKDTISTVTFITENIEKMCNFCHNIDVENHPVNVDSTIDISKKLPLSKDKKVVCITCHDPHGTLGTINFLRERYVADLEFGKYENPHSVKEFYSCMKCHTNLSKEKKDNRCKYENDFILLCYNCHGTDPEKCHPINIELKKDMKLPEGFNLNDDDQITCVTCHTPDCSGDEKIRYRNLDKLFVSNCNDCHNFSEFKNINPHLGKEETATCFYCHKKDEKIEGFGMSQKFVCLRCHAYMLHPGNVEHNVVPKSTMTLLPQMKLDNKGKIKCSTCHDPHSTDKINKKLITIENMTICEGCHQS